MVTAHRGEVWRVHGQACVSRYSNGQRCSRREAVKGNGMCWLMGGEAHPSWCSARGIGPRFVRREGMSPIDGVRVAVGFSLRSLGVEWCAREFG